MNDVLTVFQVEFVRRVTSRPFLAGLVVGIVAVLVMIRLPSFMIGLTKHAVHDVVLVGTPEITKKAGELLKSDYTVVATVPQASDFAALLDRYRAGQAIVLQRSSSGLGITVYARDPANVSESRIGGDLLPLRVASATNVPQSRIDAALRQPVVVRSTNAKFSSSGSAETAHDLVFMMIFVLYIVTIINSQLLMGSVAEEKTSRIAEMLVSTIRPVTLLVGKILAAAALAFVQLVTWIAVAAFLGSGPAPAAASGAAAPSLSAVLGSNVLSAGTLAIFVVLFLLGLLQLATMFAGVASMINRTEDIGSLTGPLFIPVVFALIAAMTAIDVPEARWAVICSFIPIVSPFVLFARLAVSNVPAWQTVTSIAVNVAALAAIAYASGKVYRIGMLFYGRAPSWGQVWRALRS